VRIPAFNIELSFAVFAPIKGGYSASVAAALGIVRAGDREFITTALK
jgi:hypothetical protein